MITDDLRRPVRCSATDAGLDVVDLASLNWLMVEGRAGWAESVVLSLEAWWRQS